MTLRTRIGLALTLWFVCEAAAFVLVAQLVGFGGAIVLGIATTLLGGSLLRRVGTAALTRLRRDGMAGGAVLRGNLVLDDTLAGVAAFLLLLPGFVTDALGLLLAAPQLRGVLLRWFRQGGLRAARGMPRGQHGPASIDLDPDDWRPADDPARRPLA